LPRYAPELNPVENLWEFLRTNFLSHRVWESYDAIVDACCAAWNAQQAVRPNHAQSAPAVAIRTGSGHCQPVDAKQSGVCISGAFGKNLRRMRRQLVDHQPGQGPSAHVIERRLADHVLAVAGATALCTLGAGGL
jgi:hypothetical protein